MEVRVRKPLPTRRRLFLDSSEDELSGGDEAGTAEPLRVRCTKSPIAPPIKKRTQSVSSHTKSDSLETSAMEEVKFKKDEEVWAMRTGYWRRAAILRVEEGDHPVTGIKVPCFLLKYSGWGHTYNEWVMSDSLMPLSKQAEAEEENRKTMGANPDTPKKPRRRPKTGSSARKRTRRHVKRAAATSAIQSPDTTSSLSGLSSSSSSHNSTEAYSSTSGLLAREDDGVIEKKSDCPIEKTVDHLKGAEKSGEAELTFGAAKVAFKAGSYMVRDDDDDIRIQPIYEDGMFTVFGEDGVTVEEAIEAVILRKISSSETAQKMIAQAADCGTDRAGLRLLCPLSHSRMDVPVRGKFCQHTECFDAKSFIRMNATETGRWICPRCSRFAPVNELVVDEFFEALLHFFKSDVLTTVVRGDKVVVSETDESARNKLKKSGPAPVICVSSDTEDDDVIFIDTIVLD